MRDKGGGGPNPLNFAWRHLWMVPYNPPSANTTTDLSEVSKITLTANLVLVINLPRHHDTVTNITNLCGDTDSGGQDPGAKY